MTDEKEPSKEALEVARCIEVPYKGMADVNFALALDAHTDARIAAALLRENYPNMCRKLIAENERERAHERDPFGPPDIQQRFRTQLARADAADERASKRGVARLESELTAEKASHAATRAELEVEKAAREQGQDYVAHLNEQLEATRKELAGWEQSARGARDEVLALREKLTSAEAELESLRAEYSVREATFDARKLELESLREPLEGGLAEALETVRRFVGFSSSEWHAKLLPCLARIEAALRAKGAELEACGELNTKLTAALLDEKTRNASEGWVKYLPGFCEKARGEPQAADKLSDGARWRNSYGAVEPPRFEPYHFVNAEPPEPRSIVPGSKVLCSFDTGTVPGIVVRVDSSAIPYLVEYHVMELVRHQTWADARSVTWLSDPPAAPAPSLKGMPVTIDDSDPPAAPAPGFTPEQQNRLELCEHDTLRARCGVCSAAPAPELPRKVEPGTTLTVGATYRVTEVADLNMAKLVAGDVLLCAENTPHALRPEWFGDYGAAYWIAWGARGKGCTYVTGLELVADAPKGKP